MYTRNQMLGKECAYETYMEQFVVGGMEDMVRGAFPDLWKEYMTFPDLLKTSPYFHGNLSKWDRVGTHMVTVFWPHLRDLVREAGEGTNGVSLSFSTSLAKTAFRVAIRKAIGG